MRPGEYKYVKYSGTMRPSEMAMTISEYSMKRKEREKSARG
jgi:hypothetical protein